VEEATDASQPQLGAELMFEAMIEEVLAATGGPVTDAERTAAAQLLGIDTEVMEN